MQNLIVHPGGPSPFLLGPAYARPRSRAPALPTPADRSAPPVSGTATRHCVAAHPSDVSPLSVSSGNARAAHVAHERRARAPAGRHPPIGARPHGIPAPRGTPTPGPPHFPSSSPSVALPPSGSLPARAAPLVLPSPLLSDPSSRAPEPPHRSPHPNRYLQPPAAHSPSRIPAEHRRRSPLPGELLPELPIPAFSCNFLTRLPLRCCRTPHPPSPPTGAPSPPTNAAARRRLHRLTVDPPFRCALALSSLSSTLPGILNVFPIVLNSRN
jgi:hypothetical protein